MVSVGVYHACVRLTILLTARNVCRATYNADDMEARSEMLLASCFAGIGFGNAGCHLP